MKYKRKCNFCGDERSLNLMMKMDIRDVKIIEKGNYPNCGEKLEEVIR